MSDRNKPELDDATLAQLQVYRERWRRAVHEAAPAVRSQAEEGVRLAYSRAGLKAPDIIWCNSPVEIERSRKDNWYSVAPGESVKMAVVSAPLMQAFQTINSLPPPTYSTLLQAFVLRTPAMAAADAALAEAVRKTRWTLSAYARALTSGGLRTPFADFASTRWAQYELRDALGMCQFASGVLGFRDELAPLDGLWHVALNAGWMVPHQRVCWLGERWTAFKLDERGRLHCDQGPAIAFADGWKRCYWKGIEVPSWVIEQPAHITSSRIDCEPDPFVRRCMIEVMKPEKYVASGAPSAVATDHVGTLWRKQWAMSDVWSAVEVVNGTMGPDGTYARYFLQVPGHVRTPLEAVAWTYGMTPERYAQLSLRT